MLRMCFKKLRVGSFVSLVLPLLSSPPLLLKRPDYSVVALKQSGMHKIRRLRLEMSFLAWRRSQTPSHLSYIPPTAVSALKAQRGGWAAPEISSQMVVFFT
ncbi:hypothetical protein PoB_006509600 [Plakobranchus ocellatus]|uniref:Secreted protein n=1 Tax=Plakobranchus ocellatus TaxID=259542 RepID=A0AAV4D324_9GAST|nr:hypothetical protein PoB_006509600 [Plakobranchus ocellatus]